MQEQSLIATEDICEKLDSELPDWPVIEKSLGKRCGDAFSLWMGSLRPDADFFDETSRIATMSVATPFLKNWLTSHYAEVITASLNEAGVPAVSVVFVSRAIRANPAPRIRETALLQRPNPARTSPDHARIRKTRWHGAADEDSLDETEDEATEEPALFVSRSATDQKSFTALLKAANAILDSRSHKEIHLETTVDKLPDDDYRLARSFISQHIENYGCPPSRRMVLAHLYREHYDVNRKLYYPPTSCDIINVCARHYEVTGKDIIGQGRCKIFTCARHAAMAIIRRIAGRSLPTIGKRFDNRDHSTVFHAMKKVAASMETGAEYRRTILHLEALADIIAWLRIEDWLGDNQNAVPQELRDVIGISTAAEDEAETVHDDGDSAEICEKLESTASDTPHKVPAQLSLFAA